MPRTLITNRFSHFNLYSISGIAVCYFTIVVTKSDPTDPVSNAEKFARDQGLTFDNSRYQHFCLFCNTHVQEYSKHCRQCDRCTAGFDHHCDWLNNDIGEKNYHLFIWLLITVLINLSISV